MLKECDIRIAEVDLKADLIMFDLGVYDVILGMDWLSKNPLSLNTIFISFAQKY